MAPEETPMGASDHAKIVFVWVRSSCGLITISLYTCDGGARIGSTVRSRDIARIVGIVAGGSGIVCFGFSRAQLLWRYIRLRSYITVRCLTGYWSVADENDIRVLGRLRELAL